MNKVALFPIETANREVDYRAWLAARVAAEGVDVVVGQQDVVYRSAAVVGGGVYLGQNIRTSEGGVTGNMVRHRNLKLHGYSVVHLDEEGGVLFGRGRDDWRRELLLRFDPTALAADDAMCVWGPFQQDVYRSVHPKCDVLATGHPRFDLCAPAFRAFYEPEVAECQRRFGRYVLVNTSFARANHHQGMKQAFSRREHYFVDDVAARLRAVGIWSLQSHGLVDFVELVHRLAAANGERNIIVRKHPSESAELYETVFAGVHNIHVVHEGPVASWIVASQATIFDSCTTGIEAWCLGGNPISYRPHDSHLSVGLPALFGRRARSLDDVQSALLEVASGVVIRPALPGEALAEVQSLALNVGAEPSAFASVHGVVRRAVDRSAGPRPTWVRSLEHHERARVAKQAARSVARRMFPERQRAFAAHRSKFQGIGASHFVEKVHRAAALQRLQVSVQVLSDDLAIVRGAA